MIKIFYKYIKFKYTKHNSFKYCNYKHRYITYAYNYVYM